jgi:hypothetical protein
MALIHAFAMRPQSQSLKESLKSSFRDMARFPISFTREIGLFLLNILWRLPQIAFRCLPLSFKWKVRFGRRYTWNSMLGLEQNAGLWVTNLKGMYKEHREKKKPRYHSGAGQPCPLSKFLSIYDMLIVVTQEMHYLDIMNLSRVSKSVREVVLPASDMDPCMEVIRRYTCPGEEKTICWICDNRICTVGHLSHDLLFPLIHLTRTVSTSEISHKLQFFITYKIAAHSVRHVTRKRSLRSSQLVPI